MSKTCAECTYLNVNPGKGDLYGKFPCEAKYEYHLATDPECYRFCRAYDRDYDTIRNAQSYSASKSGSSGCYLTTMLCNVLGMDDNNTYLQTMREFRDSVLQKNEQYKPLLVEYDIIGPKIADAIQNDPMKEALATHYFTKYIIPITNLIKDKQYESAVNNYVRMTTTLYTIYGIPKYNISSLEIETADIKQSGHGKYKVKTITNE